MSVARLRERAPSATFVAVAGLFSHRLKLHKSSKDGSAKCDAASTGYSGDCVIGVVFEIAEAEKPVLDRKEDLGSGYEEKDVEVVTPDGQILRPRMYYATDIDPSLRPYHWYKRHVLIGARENNLPAEYIEHIEAIEAIDDPDKQRCSREIAIYR